MASSGGTIALISLGTESYPSHIQAPGDQTIASLAWQVRKQGSRTKCPQLVFDGTLLPYECTVAGAGLPDGAQIQVLQLAEVMQAPRLEDVVRQRPPLDGDCAFVSSDVLNVAGYFLEKRVSSIIEKLPSTLLAVDIRRCKLESEDVRSLFAALPVSVSSLRACDNFVGAEAMRKLADADRKLKVLDVGYAAEDDDDDGEDEVDMDSLRPLVGPHIEELGLAEFAFNDEEVASLVETCSGLKQIDLTGLRKVEFNTFGALGRCCPLLEEILAAQSRCPSSSLNALLIGCPKLRILVIGACEEVADVIQPDGDGMAILRLECQTKEDMLAANKLKAQRLVICWNDQFDDVDNPFKDTPTCDSFAAGLAASTATELELGLPALSESILKAAGARLSSVRIVSVYTATERRGLLPALAAVMQTHTCLNLREIVVDEYEQINAYDVQVIAGACPLLELVNLRADKSDFQAIAIDEGIRVLGQFSKMLQRLDVAFRKMDNAAAVLAEACAGWPRLRCLSAAYTTAEDWGTRPAQECLPHALAAHCPSLEELELVGHKIPAHYKAILEKGCPCIGRECFTWP